MLCPIYYEELYIFSNKELEINFLVVFDTNTFIVH